MPLEPNPIVEQALKVSKQSGLTAWRPLGGGEMNETYQLEFEGGDRQVLRMSRDVGQASLGTEARALGMLKHERVPHVLFFDRDSRINDRMWILETYVSGRPVDRLDIAQFRSLGSLLATIHQAQQEGQHVDIWQFFLNACKQFGDEQVLLNHSDPTLRQLLLRFRDYVRQYQPMLATVTPSLVHGDATPSNVLVDGDAVGLIDWEFSAFTDPMAEFSTIYYDDMEYNRGKWRVHITQQERDALFGGYEAGGGKIDIDRVALWMNVDKMGAAVFLYWRIHTSGRSTDEAQLAQYKFDLDNLLASLETNLT